MAKENEQIANKQSESKTDTKVFSYDDMKQMMFAATSGLDFRSLLDSKDKIPTYSNYKKEDYRTYVENPRRNEKELRNMSQFLARVSMPYRRILWYFATIYLFYWNLAPVIDTENPPDENNMMKQFYEMCKTIDKLHMPVEMTNILYITLRDGIYYGFLYEDDKSIFFHRLNPDYCKPVQLESGCFNFAFDFSYFTKYPEALETWDSSFKTGWNAYQSDKTNNRWQLIDPQKSICIKADPDLDENIPFFLGIFEALLDLIDARTLQRNKDIIQNYKLIVQKLPMFKEGNEKALDDFRIQLETAKRFNGLLSDSVPEAVGVAMSPMDIDTVEFDADDNSSALVSTSMGQVFDDSGVSQLIFNSKTSGSVGVDASTKVDAASVWKIIKNIELWVRRLITYRQSTIDYKFDILDINIWNKDASITRELSLATSGVPNKMRLAATAGISPMETVSNMYFENNILKIHESWIPLRTSYTLSSDDAGRPENKEVDDVAGNSDSTETSGDSGEREKVEE